MVVLAYVVLASLLFGGRVTYAILSLPIGIVATILSIPFSFSKRSTAQGAFGGIGVTLALFWLVSWAFQTLAIGGVWRQFLFTIACLTIPFLMRNTYIKVLNEELESSPWSGQKTYENFQKLEMLRGLRVGEIIGVFLLVVFTIQQ